MDPYRDRRDHEPAPKQQPQLRALLAWVRRHCSLIGGLGLLAGVLAATVSLVLPDRYEAVAIVRIDQPNSQIVGMQTVAREVEIIRSRAIAQRVIDQLYLMDDLEFTQPAMVERWASALGIPGSARFASTADNVAHVFARRLEVRRVPVSALIEIRFASADRFKAARIANAVAESYAGLQIAVETDAPGRESVDSNAIKAEQPARDAQALVLARHATAQAKSRYEHARRVMLDQVGEDLIADVLQTPSVRPLRDQLTMVLQREAELAAKNGPRHPETQKLGAQVAKAQAELGVEIGKIVKSLRTEFQAAASRERQLQASLRMLRAEVSRSKQRQETLRELPLVDARLVTAADVPLYPTSPKRKQIVLMAILAGLGLGVTLAYLIECCAVGFTHPREIEVHLGLGHLASIPLVQHGEGGEYALRVARLQVADPKGAFAEAVRALRHELDARPWQGAGRTILVASAVENEGRTTLASNLALAYAAAGRQTLLVDADLRTRGLTERLGVSGQAGLVRAIVDGLPPHTVALRDARSGLSFLPAGIVRGTEISPAEALGSPEFTRLLHHLQGHFDVIVVDAPPILPVADARVLAARADQIAFVVSWRSTAPALAKRALRHLEANRTKIAGAVLNLVDTEFHAQIATPRLGSPHALTHQRDAA